MRAVLFNITATENMYGGQNEQPMNNRNLTTAGSSNTMMHFGNCKIDPREPKDNSEGQIIKHGDLDAFWEQSHRNPAVLTRICNRVYFGNCIVAMDEEALLAKGITHVINCAGGPTSPPHRKIKTSQLPIRDAVQVSESEILGNTRSLTINLIRTQKII